MTLLGHSSSERCLAEDEKMRLLPTSALLILALWSGSQVKEATAPWAATKSSSQWRQQAESDLDLWTSSGLVRDLSLPDTLHAELEVRYGRVSVVMNGTLTPAQTAMPPTMVRLRGAVNCMPPFALVMVDPDAPSRRRPTARSWLHWMVVNAKSTRRLHEGKTVKRYNGPTPPRRSGPHRYVFLAFCQGRKRVRGRKIAPRRRNNFNLAKFIRKLKAGNPFGGNFFYAENS
ncbi:protein D3-like [Amblyomma americanum]